MVIHHAYGLHEGVANGRAYEIKSPFFKVLAHGVRTRCFGG